MTTLDKLDHFSQRDAAALMFEPVFDFSNNGICIHALDCCRTGEASEDEIAEDRAYLRAALHSAASLPVSSLNVTVHVSTVLNDPGLADFILAATREEGVAPPCIVIEIEEDTVSALDERFGARVKNLRTDGIRVAFRISHASDLLSIGLPPDFLKISRDLVASIDRDATRRGTLRAIVDVMRSAGRQVVAEGVETWLEVAALREAGINLIQGSLLCPPRERQQSIGGSAA